MSLAQIIEELPKLSSQERSVLLRRLRELSEQDEMQFLHEAADSMFKALDEQEAKDVQRKAR